MSGHQYVVLRLDRFALAAARHGVADEGCTLDDRVTELLVRHYGNTEPYRTLAAREVGQR